MDQSKTTYYTLALTAPEVLEMVSNYLVLKGGKALPTGATPAISASNDGTLRLVLTITTVQ